MSYFITAIAYYPQDPKYDKPYKVMRTFGHFGLQSLAEMAIEKNSCDMHECLYNFIVLEEIGFGIHALGDNQTWFKWNDLKQKWFKIKKPKWAEGTLNWAIG